MKTLVVQKKLKKKWGKQWTPGAILGTRAIGSPAQPSTDVLANSILKSY